jgi:hypothetical protein
MSTESEGYLAYMLRLWQADANDQSAWRASLESPHTGERHGFSSLSLLFSFLEERTVGQQSGACEPHASLPAQAGRDHDAEEHQPIAE